MSSFDETFDARLWIQEHGAPSRGCGFTLRLEDSNLSATIQIPSCASWNIPELGVGQGEGDQHEGFRGTIYGLLEKARGDIARNRGLYGEAAAPKFDALLAHIDRFLQLESGEVGALSLSVRDPSGLCVVPSELLAGMQEQINFVRSEKDNKALGIDEGQKFLAQNRQLGSALEIAELVRQSKRIVALTGAGISVESGITPFRNPSAGDKGSVWGTFDAAKMTVQNFNTDVAVTKDWWTMKRSLFNEMDIAAPNPAHSFFAMLEQEGKLGAVVTQNIDSLHQKAGVPASKVIELHGHCRGLICSDNRTLLNQFPYRLGNCTFAIPAEDTDSVMAAYKSESSNVPMCPSCNSPLRSEVVMFGQPLPQEAVDAASDALDQADLLFIIGSTLLVSPANELPSLALRNGTPIVMINYDATKYDAYCKGLVRQDAGKFLAVVAEELKRMPPSAVPCVLEEKETAKAHKPTAKDAKQARVAKEASRVGKEISVNAKACGMSFFCTAVAEPEGDLDLLEQSLTAMNRECADIGKMLFSAGIEQLVVLAYVPEALSGDGPGEVNCKHWLQEVARSIGGDIHEQSGCYDSLLVLAGADAFPIKLKEPGIMAAIHFLKGRGLFPDEEDDDEFVFGDDDFPM